MKSWNWNELKWMKKLMSLAEDVMENHNESSPGTGTKFSNIQKNTLSLRIQIWQSGKGARSPSS